jgi:hypothetical protein
MAPHITYESGVYLDQRTETIREMLSQSPNVSRGTNTKSAETAGHSRLSGLIERFLETCSA